MEDVPKAEWNNFDAYCSQLQRARQQVFDFVCDLNRGALVLAGGCGCGKTHLARVIREQWQSGGEFISEPELVAAIQSGYNGQGETEQHILARYRAASGLILDDVGTAHVKAESRSWIEGIYWRLLDMRAARRLPTVLTTNLKMDGLGVRLGTRAMSRLAGMMGDAAGYVDLFGVPDYRMRGWRQQ